MMLQLQNIDVGYRKNPLLHNIQAEVAEGNFVGVLGVNGIGKSTLLKTISGLLKPLSGKVFINRQVIHELSFEQKSALVSVASTERAEILYMTVREFVSLGKMRFTNAFNLLSSTHKSDVEKIIESLNLRHLSDKYIGEISDGEKQKAVIARAVAQDTLLMILDEPTAFLDFKNKRLVFEYLAALARNEGKIIIASSHDLELAFEFGTSWWVIDEARSFRVEQQKEKAQKQLGV